MVSPGGGGVTEGDRGADRQTLPLTQCPIVKQSAAGHNNKAIEYAVLIEAEKEPKINRRQAGLLER